MAPSDAGGIKISMGYMIGSSPSHAQPAKPVPASAVQPRRHASFHLLRLHPLHVLIRRQQRRLVGLLPVVSPAAPAPLSSRSLSLLERRPRLALVAVDGVQHHLDGLLLVVVLVALAPVVADGVGKDGARLVEGRRHDGPADARVALEAVLSVLVPEVEGAVRPGGAEGAVDGVEGDVVDGEDVGDVVGGRVAVALEGEVGPAESVSVELHMKMARMTGRRRCGEIKHTTNPSPRHIEWHTGPRCCQSQNHASR